MAAAKDVQAIVHFGGAPLERPWEEVLNANIRGSYHIYEAARKNGVRRVVYASSVHAIGYHRLEDQIDANAPHRPDGLYGLSKCFVEDLGRLYWDKFGIETAALRLAHVRRREQALVQPLANLQAVGRAFAGCVDGAGKARRVMCGVVGQRGLHGHAFSGRQRLLHAAQDHDLVGRDRYAARQVQVATHAGQSRGDAARQQKSSRSSRRARFGTLRTWPQKRKFFSMSTTDCHFKEI